MHAARAEYGQILRICGFILIVAGFFTACSYNPSANANDILGGFRVEPGFQLELVAAEPLLEDPVDMEIDEFGNMYVVEMTGNPSNNSGTGKVKLLKDTNSDGKMDKGFPFASGLRMPGGVMRWKKGIIVTDPPNVLYFEDENGDNVADKREVILTGFDSTDLESNVNNPYYGIDNWIYLANGGKTGAGIRYASKNGGPVLPHNADGQRVRFRPEAFGLEALSGRTQFGHTEDIAGRALLVNNAIHIYEEVIAAKYLKRNPALLVSSATEQIADHTSEVFPNTVNPENQLLTDAGVFTAACGITAYLGGAFGKGYDSVVFVAEPAHNLIHTDKLSPDGEVYKASRMHADKEFLTSTDPWFRPVNFYIGPQGELYVVDYYRQFIEGPAFMSEEVLKTANLYNGNDKGRIYKITRKEAANAALPSKLTDKLLLEKLCDKNIWWRKTAQRLIIDKKDTGLSDDLNNIVLHSTSPEGKLHALWTLEGLNRLSPGIVLHALKDPTNYIRENAIKLAELHYLNDPAITGQLLNMYDEADTRVRFQLTCTIGEIKTPQAATILEKILFKYIDDPWMQVAALSSPFADKEKLLAKAISKYSTYPLLIERLSAMIANTAPPEETGSLLNRALTGNGNWQPAVLRGIAAGLEDKNNFESAFNDQQCDLLKTILHHPDDEIRNESLNILQKIGVHKNKATSKYFMEATSLAQDASVDARQRTAAVHLLALDEPAAYVALFKTLVNTSEPVIVQLAAIDALSDVPGISTPLFLLQQWNVLTPEIKDAAINTFMTGRERVAILLDALQNKKVQASMIGWPRSVRLMAGRWPKQGEATARDSILIKQARALLSRKDTPKKDIIKQYAEKVNGIGNKDVGKKIFAANCGVCHQVNNAHGVKLGPDLSTVKNWNAVELVTKILDPGQSIKGGYELWDITLVNGRYIQGIITAESPAAITVNNVTGVPEIVARKDIKSISSSGMTIMPTGFEKQISHEQMADLMAYLKNE